MTSLYEKEEEALERNPSRSSWKIETRTGLATAVIALQWMVAWGRSRKSHHWQFQVHLWVTLNASSRCHTLIFCLKMTVLMWLHRWHVGGFKPSRWLTRPMMHLFEQLRILPGVQLMPIYQFFSWGSHFNPSEHLSAVRPSPHSSIIRRNMTPVYPCHSILVSLPISFLSPQSLRVFFLSGPKNATGFSRGKLLERYVALWAGSVSGIPFFRV